MHSKNIEPEEAGLISRFLRGGQDLQAGDVSESFDVTEDNCCLPCLA